MTTGLIVGGIVLFLALLAALAWVLGSRAKARVSARYPAPGTLVDVGGFRMHIHCQGNQTAGRPTVVLEAAHSEASLTWAGIQPEVAKFAPVCTYDRAGLGWSEPSPNPRTAESFVKELHTLLRNAGIEPPYVLVGHSIGGMYVRLFAHEHPDEVAGLVLVDATHEAQYERLPAAIAKAQAASNRIAVLFMGLMHSMSSAGLLAPLAATKRSVWPIPMPTAARAAYQALVFAGTPYFDTCKRETLAMPESLAQVRARKIGALGSIPLTVISAGRPAIAAGHGISEAEAERFKQVAAELHCESAALSTRGKRVMAEQSGHYVHVDQPALVVDAIREVVQAARASAL